LEHQAALGSGVGVFGFAFNVKAPPGVYDLYRSFIRRMPIRLRFLGPFKPEH
jgi:hypothetical protein